MNTGVRLLYQLSFIIFTASAGFVQWCPLQSIPQGPGQKATWQAGCCYVTQGMVYPINLVNIHRDRTGKNIDAFFCYLRSFTECVRIDASFVNFIYFYCGGVRPASFTPTGTLIQPPGYQPTLYAVTPDQPAGIVYAGSTGSFSFVVVTDLFMVLSNPVTKDHECYYFLNLKLYKVYRTGRDTYGYATDASGNLWDFNPTQTQQMQERCYTVLQTSERIDPPPPYIEAEPAKLGELIRVGINEALFSTQFTQKLNNTVGKDGKKLQFDLDLDDTYRKRANTYFQTNEKPKNTFAYTKESYPLTNHREYVKKTENLQRLLNYLVPIDDINEIIHKALILRDKSASGRAKEFVNYQDSAMFNCVIYYRERSDKQAVFYLVCLFYFRSFWETVISWSDKKHKLSVGGMFDPRKRVPTREKETPPDGKKEIRSRSSRMNG